MCGPWRRTHPLHMAIIWAQACIWGGDAEWGGLRGGGAWKCTDFYTFWSGLVQIHPNRNRKMLSVQSFTCLYPLFGPRSFEYQEGIGKPSSLERAYELEYGLYPWPLEKDTRPKTLEIEGHCWSSMALPGWVLTPPTSPRPGLDRPTPDNHLFDPIFQTKTWKNVIVWTPSGEMDIYGHI